MADGVATVTAKETRSEMLRSHWVIGHRIFAIPAHTLQGMAVKLRASDSLGLDDFPDNEAFASIAADIRRLAADGAGATAATETVDDRIRRLSGIYRMPWTSGPQLPATMQKANVYGWRGQSHERPYQDAEAPVLPAGNRPALVAEVCRIRLNDLLDRALRDS